MSLIIKNIVDIPVTEWAGGNIAQLAIYPPEEAYESKQFLWYVSSASVELETSCFTVMPDYDRWILMLDRPVTLSHDGNAAVDLLPMVPHLFDGSSHTISTGRAHDFNLILRKGLSEGSLSSCKMASREFMEIVEGSTPHFRHFMCLVYCAQGQCRFADQELGDMMLYAGQYAVLDHGLVVENTFISRTELVVCSVYY